MAGFCSGCGFPMGDNAAFCPQCGTRQASGSSGAPPRPAAQAPGAPATGSGLKILVAILVCVGLAGAVVIGGLWYVAHRVKETVVAKARENGVDLGSIVPPERTSSNRHATHKACDLLSQEEAARLLGEPIVRTDYQDGSCLYYGPPGLSLKLAQEQASKAFDRAKTQAPGSGVDLTNAVDQLANSVGAVPGPPGSGGEMPLLMLNIEENGKGAMMALNATAALAGGVAHAADPEGKAPSVAGQIKGLGDQAVRLPKLGLHVLQGDAVIGLLAGPVPDADAKTIEIARLILKRL